MTKAIDNKKNPKTKKAPAEKGESDLEQARPVEPTRERARAGEPVARTSADIVGERVQHLGRLFPEAVGEKGIDFERLRLTLGESLEPGPERYNFTWAGKRDAVQVLQVPTRAALLPDPSRSIGFDESLNLIIEGDNLEVLKLLYKPYFGRIKMVYIDPPYNTGGDFVYRDDYSDPLQAYLTMTGQTDEAGNVLTSNPETGGRYHSAWLSMIYPRLFLARQLLRDDGLIFVSIDDHELADLRLMMNEIFGEENALPILVWNRGHSQQQGIFKEYHEYIVPYARSRAALAPFTGGEGEIVAGAMKKISRGNPASDFSFPAGTRCEAPDGTELKGTWGDTETVTLVKGRFRVKDNKLVEDVILRAGWTQANQMKKYFAGEPVTDTRGQKVHEFYFSSTGKLKCRKERVRITPSTVLEGYGTQSRATEELAELFDGKAPVNYPKPLKLMKDLINWVTDGEDEMVLDFFAGSGTTAHAVLDLNREDGGSRRFILIQLPEPTPKDSVARKAGFKTITEICIERVRRALGRMKKEREGKLDVEHTLGDESGFRTFRLADSSFKFWKGAKKGDAEEYEKQMEFFADALTEGWKAHDVIWEVAVKEGYSLTSKVEELPETNSNTVYRVTDDSKKQSFLVCLEDKIKPDTLAALRLGREDLFVCRDSALDDTAAANLALQCRLKTI